MAKSKFSQGTGFWYNLLSGLSFGLLPLFHYIYNRSTGSLGNIREQWSGSPNHSSLISQANSGASSNLASSSSNPGNFLLNWLTGMTGSGLTDMMREQNAWTASREDLAWERNLSASNTAYQRQVSDLAAAGINPIMAVSNGVSLPSASSSSSASASPAGNLIGQLVQLFMAKSQIDLTKAQIDKTHAEVDKLAADTKKVGSETKGIDIVNNYLDESERLRLEGQRLANALSDSQKAKLDQDIRNAEQELKKLIAETKNEEYKNDLILAQTFVQHATANRITEMLPYEKALSKEQSKAARASAASAFAQAAYQNGLIDNGMISIAVEQAGYQRDSAEYNAAIDRVRSQISGDKPIEGAAPIVDNLVKAFGKAKYYIWK